LPASPAEAPVAQTAAPLAFFISASNTFWFLVGTFVILSTIGFGVMIIRQHRAPPPIPQWTRGGSYPGPRSLANLSPPATLSPPPETFSPLSYAEATTVQGTPSDSKPRSAAPPPVAEGTAPRTRTSSIAPDVSTIDTLLDELDPDLVEERAVREAWAAARNAVERSAEKKEIDTANDAILQAIEDAERDLFAPPAPAQAAIDSSLDDELLHAPQRPGKAAA
jgi:hypothetical protein